MATAPLAPVGIASDPDAQKEYVDALNRQLQALEGRRGTNWFALAGALANPGRSGSAAEGFGSAMTELGKQQEVDEARELPIAQMRAQLAGQKYQMAQDAKAQDMILGALGGMSLQDAAQAISTPQGAVANPALLQRLSMIQAMIPPGSKYAEQVKNMIDTQTKVLDYGIKSGQLTLDQIKVFNAGLETQQKYGISPIMPNMSGVQGAPTTATPAPSGSPKPAGSQQTGPSPVAPPEFKDEPTPRDSLVNTIASTFDIEPKTLSTTRTRDQQQDLWNRWKAGEKNIFMPTNPADFPNQKEFHGTAIDVPTSVPENFMNANGWYRPFPKDDPVHYEPIGSRSTARPTKTASTETAATPSATPQSTAQFGYTEVSPNKYKMQYSGREIVFPEGEAPERKRDVLAKAVETEQQIYKQAVETEAKPWQEKQTELMKYDNYATQQNLNRTDTILKLLNNNPQVVGLLQNAETRDVFNNFLNGLGAAAQEGIKAGNFGQISLPVEKYLQTANLNKDERKALAELTRHISQEFLAGMKANRGLLGVNPTDNDARLFQAAQATTGNLAENIYSWAQGRAAEYETMNKMYKGYVSHRKQYGVADPAAYFINEDSPYHSAVRDYAKTIGKITAQSPGVQ